MGWGYKNFLPPSPSANSQDVLMQQCRIHKGTKLWWLPMKWWNRTNGIPSGLLNCLRRGQLNVARANGFLEMTRDGVLISAYHDQHFLTGIHLENERFDHLARCIAKGFRDFGSAFCRRWWKRAGRIRDTQGIEIVMDRKLHALSFA